MNQLAKDTSTLISPGAIQDIANTVEALSSFPDSLDFYITTWTKPFTVFYPDILPFPFLGEDLTLITNWINLNFPILDPILNTYNFASPQQAIVFCHQYKTEVINKETVTLTDYTQCNAENVSVCTQCIQEYYGTVPCNGGEFVCEDNSTSCTTCKDTSCYYHGPPYTENESIKLTKVISGIEAKLSLNFTDRREHNSVQGLFFSIINNKWVFDRYL
jgi:hypothetical protein